MIPAAIAGVASVAGAMINKSAADKQASSSKTQGIDSPMAGNQVDTTVHNPSSVSGSQSDEYMKGMAQDAFKSGFNAVMGHGISSAMSPSASEQGKAQRDYLAAAFPEMNPWERAGASATQQGVQMAQNKQAMQLQAQQIQGAKDVARINGETSRDVAEIQSGTSRRNVDVQSRDTRYGIDMTSGNVDKQIIAMQKKVAADTKLAIEQAKSEAEAKSVVGKTVKDAVYAVQNAVDSVSNHEFGIKDDSMLGRFVKDDVPKIKKNLEDYYNQAMDYIDKKFGRDNAKGVQSQYDAGFADENPYVKGLKK